jgi:hypothetical protein
MYRIKSISNFTNNLTQLFAAKQRSLKLYSKLIRKLPYVNIIMLFKSKL